MSDVSPRVTESAAAHARGRIVRFGRFEVNLGTGELRKSGIKIKLHGQPFEVLAMLLERPGEMVTREELQQKLWVAGICVDFEHGLNKTISKLRETLDDDADRPRYIETVPRRGYRFVGSIAPSLTGPAEVLVPAETSEQKAEKRLPEANRRKKIQTAVVAAATLCFLLAAGYFWIRSSLSVPRVVRYRQLTTDRRDKGKPCDSALGSRTVTDGARVFFSENGFGLKQVSTSGGEVTDVANPLGCFPVFDISPDKTELLGAAVTDPASEDGPLWALSVVSGLAHKIGDLKGHAAGWSPDGQSIAYVTGSVWRPPNDLFIASKDGTQARKVARIESGLVLTILWSPDQNALRLSVVSDSDATSIWEISKDGTNLHRVRQLPQEIDHSWGPLSASPDQKYFLCAADSDLWVIGGMRSIFPARTSAPTQLTSGPIGFGAPTFSPDGKTIFAVGGMSHGELLRYDLNSRKLEPFLSGIPAEQVDFSRDGLWVTYVTFPEGELWRSKVDGSERLQLSTPPLHAVVPRWSPDGTRIAFSAFRPRSNPSIYVISANGGTPELISQTSEAEVDSTWTPDGNSLVFGGSLWAASKTKISIIDLRTRRVSVVPGSERMDSPRLSPDGRLIFAEIEGEHRSFLFDRNSQKWSEVEGRVTGSVWPQWSSDSKYVYLGRDPELPGGSYHIFRLRVADLKVEPFATVEIPEGLTGIWGGWMSTAPDGSPLLLRDQSIQEIYAVDVDHL